MTIAPVSLTIAGSTPCTELAELEAVGVASRLVDRVVVVTAARDGEGGVT
jgi:hypothetical protein